MYFDEICAIISSCEKKNKQTSYNIVCIGESFLTWGSGEDDIQKGIKKGTARGSCAFLLCMGGELAYIPVGLSGTQ